MLSTVKEDGRTQKFGIIGADRLRAASIVAVCAMSLLGGTFALAQETEKKFQATVLDISGSYDRVYVPLNRSITVETTIEVSRADVIASTITDVQVISPTRILITGKSYGTTSVVLQGANKQQYVIEVVVELDLERLNESIDKIDPQAEVDAKSVLGNIVLTGTVSTPDQAAQITELASLFLPQGTRGKDGLMVQNHLRVVGEQQVLLRCVVAEVTRSAVRELGVNGFLAGENLRDVFLASQLGGINPINIGAAADFPVTETIPFLTGENGIPTGANPTLTLGFPRVQMQAFIKTMADNALLRVLAEPNLVAVSGESATFLAGGEFPVPVPQGNQQVTIEFREFGIRLSFTPTVIGHQMIRLRVRPEVSELDFSTAVQFQGLLVPGLRSRSAETTVDIGSGQTFAIAGLLSEQVRGIASRIPGIGDLPILGSLFRSVKFERSMTELVILVTPEIVAPLDAHQLVELPGSDRQDPNDYELYMLGMLEGQTTANSDIGDMLSDSTSSRRILLTEPEELSLHGPWGYANAMGTK